MDHRERFRKLRRMRHEKQHAQALTAMLQSGGYDIHSDWSIFCYDGLYHLEILISSTDESILRVYASRGLVQMAEADPCSMRRPSFMTAIQSLM